MNEEDAIWHIPEPTGNEKPCSQCKDKPHISQYSLIDFDSGDDSMVAFCSFECMKKFAEENQ